MSLEVPDDRRKRRTHTAVLRAAQQLFLRHGYRATTIELLAGEADVAVSSIYANFRAGKADVYAALAVRTAVEHAEAMTAPVTGDGGVLAVAFDRYVAFHRENPLALRLLALTDVDSGESELVAVARARIDGVLGGVITTLAGASGDYARIPILTAWATINGAYVLHRRGTVDQQTLDRMLATARTALLTHHSRAPEDMAG